MPPLDEFARRRLRRVLMSLEGAIAQFEAQGAEDVQPNVKRLRRLCDDIRTVLELTHNGSTGR